MDYSQLKPQDIVVLLKILTTKKENWLMKELADELYISAAEITNSLNRSVQSGLLSNNKKRVLKSALLELLVHGVKYVFPQKLGRKIRGIPTAFSYSPLKELIQSQEQAVWQDADGTERGYKIIPLYPNAPKAALKDHELHEYLALIDAIRVGSVREQNIAKEELEKRLL